MTRRPRLSANVVSAICAALAPIGEEAYNYSDGLRTKGHAAHLPFEDFILSFAQDTRSVELHRMIWIELAKRALGMPWPPLQLHDEYKRIYFKSKLLDSLAAGRDSDNGAPESELNARFGFAEAWWRRQIDPCWREIARLQSSNRELYEHRWSTIRTAMRRHLLEEARRLIPSASFGGRFGKLERYQLFADVMEVELETLGFVRKERQSKNLPPIFTNRLNADWRLCWIIEDLVAFSSNSVDGYFEPTLQLRHQNFNGSLKNAKPGEVLVIKYESIVPGFFNAYRCFKSLQELAAIIKAHVSLYRLMENQLLSSLKKSLAAE